MYIRFLYSNINRNEGLSALEEYLNKRKSPPTEIKRTQMQHTLILKRFTFNSRRFMQTKRWTISTAAEPSYATIYLEMSENTYIYPEIKNDCFFYAKYIDNINHIDRRWSKIEQFSHQLKYDAQLYRIRPRKVYTINRRGVLMVWWLKRRTAES